MLSEISQRKMSIAWPHTWKAGSLNWNTEQQELPKLKLREKEA